MKHNEGLASAIADALGTGTSAAALTAGASAGPETVPATPAPPAAPAAAAPVVPAAPAAAVALDAGAIRDEAIKAERTRVAGISALPSAAARPAATSHAIESGMSVEAATAFLAKMPEEGASSRDTLGSRMDSVAHPPRPGADPGRRPTGAGVAIDAGAIFADRAKAQNLPR